MLNCSINQILKLWSELEDCYRDTNGYGGRVAEIYAYSLRQESPAHSHLRSSTPDGGVSAVLYGDDIAQENLETGSALVYFCKKFAKDRECRVLVNGKDCFSDGLSSFSFDHRVNVSVLSIEGASVNLKSYLENINNLRKTIKESPIGVNLARLTEKEIESIIVSLESNLSPESVHSPSGLSKEEVSKNNDYYMKVHEELCVLIGREIKLEY